MDWYITDEEEKWDCAAWAVAKRKEFLLRFFDAMQEVYDANPEFPGKGSPSKNKFTVTDSSRKTKCKHVPSDKEKTVPCFKISLRIHLRSGHYIA